MSNGKVEITYSNWGTHDEAAAIQKTADKFNSEQDKIEVKVIAIPRDFYIEELDTLAAEGRMPDCGIMAESAVLEYAARGLLTDVSDMYAEGEDKPLDSLVFRDKNGKTIAYSTANEILLLFYNRDLFDRAGVAYPPATAENAWTWDEFMAAARKLTLDADGRRPGEPSFDPSRIMQYGAMVETLTWQLEVWALSNGGGFYSADGSRVVIDKAPAVEAIQKIADLHLIENVAPLSAGMGYDGIERSICGGAVAMATGGTWNVGTYLADAKKKKKLNYGVAVLPYMKEKVTLCTGGPNVVFSQSGHQDEAKEFLKWYAREENIWYLVETGIWMPTLSSYYADESFSSAVMDYAVKSAKPTSWYYVNNTLDFNNLLGSMLGEVWTGDKTAQDVITANIGALRKAHEGNQEPGMRSGK